MLERRRLRHLINTRFSCNIDIFGDLPLNLGYFLSLLALNSDIFFDSFVNMPLLAP